MRSLIKRMKRWLDGLPSNRLTAAAPPEGYRALVAKADAARDRRDWTVAADNYEAALAVRPDQTPIWVQLGNMSKEMRNFARAQFAYWRALHLQPNDADAHL